MRIKTLGLCLICAIAFKTSSAQSKYFEKQDPALSFTLGAGASGYYGDLVEKYKWFRSPSYSVSAGLSYRYNRYFDGRVEFSALRVKGEDSKNKRADLRARNLNFTSNVWDLNVAIDYNLLGLDEHRKFSPYLFFGIGICHFNPYTTDRSGNKVYLQPQGTEGQGLSAYPNREKYDRTVIELPFGAGIKYAINSKLTLGLEVKYRYIDTDYLDDVSNPTYPSKAVLAASNPNLPMLTYRGDELPGGAPYPTSGTAVRGNPNKRDSYYTAQFKIAYKFCTIGN